MAFLGGILGGGPSGSDIRGAAQFLHDPNASAYQIQGVPQFQNQMQAYSDGGLGVASAPVGGYDQQQAAANMMQQTAMGNGPSLARANMQAGLNNTNAAIASQAMTNMGNTGAGVTQRNLLNAQAAAANNVLNQAGVASAQEQLGAQQNFIGAAQGLATTSLAQRGQQQQAYGQAAQNQQANFGANLAQSQANMYLDQAQTKAGLNRYNNEIQAVTGDANQGAAIGKTAGNVVGGVASFMSDEACKEQIDKSPVAAAKVGQFLAAASGMQPGAAAPTMAPPQHTFAPPQMLQHNGGMVSIPMQEDATGLLGSGLGNTIGNKIGAGLQRMMHQPTVTSDERCKQMAQSASSNQLSHFMDSMEPSTFKYKDQGYSPGTHLGVMAQDVDDSAIGSDMVDEQGGVKQINIPKALGATLASLAYLNQKVDKLEGGRHVA